MNGLENLDNKTRAEQVNIVACYILEQNGCTEESKTMHGKDVFRKYKELRTTHVNIVDIPENTFSVTLSMLSQQSSSVSYIKSTDGKRGYYADLSLRGGNVTTGVSKIKECDLYESIECWLDTKAIVIKNIAQKRKGAKWQNVDVLGISTHYYCDTQCVDIYSVEVKLSMDNWRQDIFEAVSHSMFANYSYFAFMIKASDIEKIDENLKIYAHKFDIGLLVVAISDKHWNAVMQQSEKISLNGKKANARIIEISIAPEHEVSRKIQNDFLVNVLQIKHIGDVYKLYQK
mgnify:CR=1 FL=1